jgi:predicted nuclease of predicted toxin-antitoxin system
MRFLIDMNLTPAWVSYLSAAGHEAVHWSVAGKADAEDEEICGFAREHRMVVLTNDLDFPLFLACSRAGSPSVILLRGHPLTPGVRGGKSAPDRGELARGSGERSHSFS